MISPILTYIKPIKAWQRNKADRCYNSDFNWEPEVQIQLQEKYSENLQFHWISYFYHLVFWYQVRNLLWIIGCESKPASCFCLFTHCQLFVYFSVVSIRPLN